MSESNIDNIKKLYIEPTSACNLSCKMCFRHTWIDEEIGSMADETIESVFDYIREHKPETVFFGGMGEPLVHRRICEMVKMAAENCKNVELITNGTCLSAAASKALLESGLTRLWISMDGFSAEEYEKIRLGGRFELITKNIEMFNSLRQGTAARLGITFVVMAENEAQLELINGFADRYKVDIVNISHAIPGSSTPSAREFYKKDIPVGKMQRYGVGYEERSCEYCPFVKEGMCFVKWDGSVVPCMQLLHSSKTFMFDIERMVYSHSFGNVCETPLFDIYSGREYTEFRERVNIFDFPTCTLCEGCDLREQNLEDCMYNEKPTCGACLWATGKVFCP